MKFELNNIPHLGIRLTQFEYSQEFVIKEEADYIIITTPRPYEPAVFIVGMYPSRLSCTKS